MAKAPILSLMTAPLASSAELTDALVFADVNHFAGSICILAVPLSLIATRNIILGESGLTSPVVNTVGVGQNPAHKIFYLYYRR
jgi:hypothetical protein